MKAPVYNHTGKKTDTIDLPSDIFSVSSHPQVLAQYLKVYLSRQRQGTKKTKTRGDVAISTAKIYRQKGTGKARHGAKSANVFVGGAVSHGPTGLENYQLQLSQKVRRLALLTALSNQTANISIISDIDKLSSKTQSLADCLTNIVGTKTFNTLLILDQPYPTLIQAARNLPQVTPTQAKRLNAYEVVKANHLVITQESLKVLVETFTDNTNKQSNSKSNKKTITESQKKAEPRKK